MLDLFAQAVTAADTSGIAGWTGTGLLGSVLAWLLFKHLPAKDQQVKEMIDAHNAAMKDKDSRFLAELKDQRIEFRESLKEVVSHCEEEMRGVTDRLTQALKNKP